jgi:hypothetical protein
VKNWDRTRCFVRQRKVIYEKEEDDILGQEKVYMGQESMIRWDRRR